MLKFVFEPFFTAPRTALEARRYVVAYSLSPIN